jgi:hypothetical protein
LFSPQLYIIRKYKLKDIINTEYNLNIALEKEQYYYINQQDNMFFRQLRLITDHFKKNNPFIVFIDCKGCKESTEELIKILNYGFIINGQHFVMTEKSASMSRNAILGFVDERYSEELDKRITMDIDMKSTVISKYLAYRGLMFSSCFCIEDWYPKIIVVDDYQRTISNQHIKYVIDKETEYIDKKTKEKKIWKDKDIAEGYSDIEIIPFDGCGIHHPLITQFIKETLYIIDENPTSIMWRLPYVKGVTHSCDYTNFLLERNITHIKDIWGELHSVEEPMIILTKSMYKGYKYFQKYKDIRDWNNYWDKFKKYNHCIGVSKWNYSKENEPMYTRVNYQILQDLELPYDDFIELSNDSLEWASKIIEGDKLYTYCFLGLIGHEAKPQNDYMKAILKNPEMLKDECVRKYLINLLKKYINEFKCGKLWMKSTFKILAPDLIMLMEYIGGLEANGILKSNEFYSQDIEGVYKGEYLIERNPHITKSEHTLLYGTNNLQLEKYCSHLEGIIMLNSDSITLQRLNSADVDGDLGLILKSDVMISGVDISLPVVIDMEDKITVPEKEINIKNIIESTILSMDNRIGEYSNVATGYHNKCPKSIEQKNKYNNYIDLVSILNGKEIDAAKTGVHFNLPRYISKYAKPLPYFMKYVGKYYSKMNKFNRANSNLNRLAWDIEKWEKQFRFKKKFKDFDYKLMIDEDIYWDIDKFNKIEEIYLEFRKEICLLKKSEQIGLCVDNYNNFFGDLKKVEILNTLPNYKYYYEKYKKQCDEVCKNQSELANYAVIICYNKYNKFEKNFAWIVAKEGIVKNIKQIKFEIPIKSEDGKYLYLGKKYKFIEYGGNTFVE